MNEFYEAQLLWIECRAELRSAPRGDERVGLGGQRSDRPTFEAATKVGPYQSGFGVKPLHLHAQNR
jgi:hypothetical protein